MPETPSCPCPICQSEGFDAGQFLDGLLDDMDALVVAADPLEAEVAGATILSTLTIAADQTGMDADLLTHVLIGGFIPALREAAGAEALAMLFALGSVADGAVAAAAAAAADQLTQAGIASPAWAAELAVPVTTNSCWRFQNPGGTEEVLVASFTRAGRSHAMMLHCDLLDCGAATEITLIEPDELPEALALLRIASTWDTGDAGGVVTEDTLDAAEWRRHVENAIDSRAVHDETDGFFLDGFDPGKFEIEFDADDADEPDAEEPDLVRYPALVLLLRARLATMPASPKPKPLHGAHIG